MYFLNFLVCSAYRFKVSLRQCSNHPETNKNKSKSVYCYIFFLDYLSIITSSLGTVNHSASVLYKVDHPLFTILKLRELKENRTTLHLQNWVLMVLSLVSPCLVWHQWKSLSGVPLRVV